MDKILGAENGNKPKPRSRKFMGIILMLLVLAEAVFLLGQNLKAKIAWASIVFDKREHYIDCEHLPFYVQAQKAFLEHSDVVAKVKAVSGVTDFRPQENKCKIFEGGIQFIKGQAVLEYKNRAARAKAEKIIGQDFFGIPYQGR